MSNYLPQVKEETKKNGSYKHLYPQAGIKGIRAQGTLKKQVNNMERNQIQKLLFLLLIQKNEFNNSYQLVKIMSSKFKIIDIVPVISDLIREGLVIRNDQNGLSEYHSTNNGVKFFNNHKSFLKEELYNNFLDHEEFWTKFL